MKWYSRLICLVLIIVGCFTFVFLVDAWKKDSIKNSTHGVVSSIETINNYAEVGKFDYGIIEFETENQVDYVNQTTFGAIDFNGKKNDYKLLFNGSILSDVQIYAGQIKATYSRNFYDLEGNMVACAKMSILIECFDNETKVSISTTNENDSIVYLNRYMTINGAILKIVQEGVQYE